ncbi:uncharacterized protein LOC105165199 [Sesamum indicum]|uniref:Uncharacterized protein LOC105165199 n=1 Tax=Sesamum indicum TaxID=4182 RepID=A0A6I9TC58_SESIN|nr:uncharacterized protein LOC105165199 [Sesamum indicum]
MSSDTKKAGNGSGAGSGGFRAKLDHYLYSGEKKHVAAGIVIIGALFGVPWYLMNRGTKHQSHQDYLERADKARSARLSTGSSTNR